jgi:hypothetical protein
MDESSNAPATKHDIARLDDRLEGLETRLEGLEARMADRLERAVATLLTGFHAHAKRERSRYSSRNNEWLRSKIDCSI